MKKSMPSRGGLVSSSHNVRRGISSFSLFDLERKQLLYRKTFYDANTSPNVLDLIGIAHFFTHPLFQNDSGLNVYCTNQVAIGWCKDKVCNTRYTDAQLRSFIKQSLAILNSCEFSGHIRPWDQFAWGKPKSIINGTIRPSWMGPKRSIDDDLPF